MNMKWHLFLVLLAASIWTWSQQPRRAQVLPTRANCFVNDMYLGAISHYPYWHHWGDGGVTIKDYHPKSGNDFSVWTWEKCSDPDLKLLQVTLQRQHITQARGTKLLVQSEPFSLKAGDELQKARFLGSPTRAEAGQTTWVFPEVEIVISTDQNQRVARIQITAPTP